jgi:aminoglycoside phosphotransferase (APT) family kinase protein
VKVWDEAVALPGADVVHGERWYHGDLFCENVLVRDGRLAGLLDLGGLAVGDPTVDLIVAWEVLDRTGRDRLRALLDVDEATWLRGRAWALSLAIGVLPYYWRTMPDRCATKLSVARAILDDAFS